MTTSGKDAKPPKYRHSCTVSKELPYSVVDGATKGPQPSVGTLQVGRVVWLDQDLEEVGDRTPIEVYVDGIGLIQVHSGSLAAVC